MNSNIKFNIPEIEKSTIKVIGVGGGGNNAVNYMFKQGIKGVDFAICNTDRQAIENSPIPIKIQLGPELTDGKGAGNKPEVGRQACIESINDIKSFLSDKTEMLFVTAGMGGGTGTGAAPIIAKTAREMGILTIGIVTKPFSFEGKKRIAYGEDGLAELRENVDTLVVISNDKLLDLYPDMLLRDAFEKVDDILSTAARGIAEIITRHGYINVDFKDVYSVMKDSGVAVMGTAVVEGDNKAKKAVEMALKSPLLESGNIKGASNILLNITTGEEDVSISELMMIMHTVQEAAGGANMIWGSCIDNSLGKALSVTIIATGFEQNQVDAIEELKESTNFPEPQKLVVNLHGEDDDSIFTLDDTHEGIKIDFDITTKSSKSQEEETEIVTEVKEKNTKVRRLKKTAIDPSKLDGDSLDEFENVPAYIRKQLLLQDLMSSKDNLSKMTITGQPSEGIKLENSYLHKKVD